MSSKKPKKLKEDQKQATKQQKDIFPTHIGITVTTNKQSQKFPHLIDPDVLDPLKANESSSNFQNEVTTPDSLPDYCDSDNSDGAETPAKRPAHNCMSGSTDHSDHEETHTSNNFLLSSHSRVVPHDTNRKTRHPLQIVSSKVRTNSFTNTSNKETITNSTHCTSSGRQVLFATPPTISTPTPPLMSPIKLPCKRKQTSTNLCEPMSSTIVMSSGGKTSSSRPSGEVTTFSFNLEADQNISKSPPALTSTVRHTKPQTRQSNLVYTADKPQIITKSVKVTSSLFLIKKSKLIKEIGRVCDIIIPQGKSEIIVTGMKNQVDAIITRLENEFDKFKDTLTTEIISVEAYYGPLFADSQFGKSLKDEFSEIEISIQCTNSNGTKRIMTIDEVFQALTTLTEGRHDNKIILLNDLYMLGLIARVETAGMKQWFIQSFFGQWDQVPHAANIIFNSNINSAMPITVKDGETFSVNLHEKKAICTRTGFEHPLMNEAVWQYKVNGDQFCSYSLYESSQIEKCYNTYQCLPVHCRDERVCYFNFRSQLEIDITANTYHLRSIKRVPPISDTFPSFSICLTGVETEIKSAIGKFKKNLHSKIIKYSVRFPQSEVVLYESHAQQYCIETTSSQNYTSLIGVPQHVTPVKAQLLDLVLNGLSSDISGQLCKFPNEWEPQTDDIELKTVLMESKEWSNIDKIWKQTMSSHPIKRIERIQNKWSWEPYYSWQKRLKEKNSGEDNEKWLFHGTRETLPEQIYKSDKPFDFRFSNPGFWGNGSYFAVNASYSAKKYPHTQFVTGNKQIFLARVLTGDSIYLPTVDRSLKYPPLKRPSIDINTRYDSVKGNTGGSDTDGSDIYVVYQHDQAYPAYLITF